MGSPSNTTLWEPYRLSAARANPKRPWAVVRRVQGKYHFDRGLWGKPKLFATEGNAHRAAERLNKQLMKENAS